MEKELVAQPVLPEMPDDAGMNAGDEAALLSEQARLFFEMEACAGWLDEYYALIAEGWSWRQAVYMIWASQPKPARVPATEVELATQVLGLSSARVIRKWKTENPHMEVRLRKLSLATLGKARAEVLEALVESATTPSYRNYRDRELFLKLTGDYVPRERLDVGEPATEQDLASLSAEELAALARIPVDNAPEPEG